MSETGTFVITGNEAAAAAVRLAGVQVVAAYPITPQSPVVETLSKWVDAGELRAEFVRVESEHSALTVCIAAATVGARVFTATSANGLAYMNEQIWWAAGARLPVVMACVNRALAAPWNVLNDQQDSMSVRDAGWIQIYCRDNQEILDSLVQAYAIAEEVQLPVMVCYDGFLLSHTAMPVTVPPEDLVRTFLPRRAPLPVVDLERPRNIGQVTFADPRMDAEGHLCHGYMEIRALHQAALERALEVIPAVGEAFATRFGRAGGGLVWSHMLADADVVFVAAGSVGTELSVAAEALRSEGIRAGVLGIRSYRPFPVQAVREALEGKELVMVVDKAMSYGYEGPICSDLRAALLGAERAPAVFGTVTGLGGRDVETSDLAEAARRAVADYRAGARRRRTDWINLKLREEA
ncbi:MAG TPA: transketolase C-terminal domain-containing protein [Anaeromyxobacteraceae bacterium]|nr:transketolase C-terminal domain-containing protein [Anaeromyxobacteraceae bacterium]